MKIDIQKEHPSLNISFYTGIFTALAVIVIGTSALIGWHIGVIPLVSYISDARAMVYNTAFLFILSGISIIAILYKYIYVAAPLIFVIMVTSVLTLLEYIFDINFGIDQILFTYGPISSAGVYPVDIHPGRMGYETTISFILASLALLLTILPKYQKLYLALSSGLGLLILGLGLLFTSGYLTQLKIIYKWQDITLMTFNAAIGFLLLSSSIIALSWYRAIHYKADIVKILPFMLPTVLFIIISLLAGKIFNEQILSNSVSYTPLAIFFVGGIITILLGVSIRFAQIANTATKTAKHFLSMAQATLEATGDGILVTDLKGKIVSYNETFLKMWQIPRSMIEKYTRKQLIDIMFKSLIGKNDFAQNIDDITKNPDKESCIELKLKTGFVFEQYSRPQYIDKVIVGQVWSYHDITAAKQLEEQLMRLATRDILTELPNRALLLDLMQESFELAKKANKFVAIILIDLDRFTQVNDTLGHVQGDHLLQAVAKRLRDSLPTNIAVGRIGGDKFLIFSNQLNLAEGVTPIIQKINRSFEENFIFNSFSLKMTCCMGVSFYPRDGQDVDILLSNTEIALLKAKEEGPNSFHFYTPGMNIYTQQCMALEADLREALKRRQFQLYYQPIFRLDDQQIVGVEALIRWQNPNRADLILPNEFIPLAEEIGIIDEIGLWVLETACHQLKGWHDLGFRDLQMAVNVSAYQFRHSLLMDAVKAILSQVKLKPKSLELELTERALLEASKESVQSLNDFRDMGVAIALDDFGTGYSSLSYLRQFFVDKLKIDYSFINEMVKSEESKVIVQTIIAMGKTLNMRVVAEGIETKKQLELLIKLGCGYGQGFYLARPMPFDECTAFLKQHHTQKNPSKTKAKQVAPLL